MRQLIVLALVASSASACGPTVTMWTQRPRTSLPGFERTALNSDRPSAITRSVLRGSSLRSRYHVDELGLLRRVRGRDDLAPRIRGVATSELTYLIAKRLETRRRQLAARLYLDAAAETYAVLLADQDDTDDKLDAEVRRFTETLYNFSVARFVKLQRSRSFFCSGSATFDTPARSYRLSMTTNRASQHEQEGPTAGERDGVWDPCYFDEFIPANEIRFAGLRNRSVSSGMGGALVAIREHTAARALADPYFPFHGKIYPVTAIIRFGDPGAAGRTGAQPAELTFYDPLAGDTTIFGAREVPLHGDFTASLGVIFARDAPQLLDLPALLNPSKYMYRAGFQLLEPYRRDKIPVLFVHGLYSSPMTWREVANELLADAEIRNNFQFWFYVYPTGLPTPYSAALLRQQFAQVLAYVDPEHDDRGTSDLVYIGHSMGGLLGRLLLHESGDSIWNDVFSRPLAELDLGESDRALLSRVFFFDRSRSVGRAVFIATPHRGSKLARSILGQFVSALVSLPAGLLNLGEQILTRNDDALTANGRRFAERVPTGVDTLSPDSPFVRALTRQPIAADVVYHSIVGVRDGSDDAPSDGVVSYASAHLDGAASELIVPAWHDVHQHPRAIAELARILHEHLAAEERRAPTRAGSSTGR